MHSSNIQHAESTNQSIGNHGPGSSRDRRILGASLGLASFAAADRDGMRTSFEMAVCGVD